MSLSVCRGLQFAADGLEDGRGEIKEGVSEVMESRSAQTMRSRSMKEGETRAVVLEQMASCTFANN